MTRVVLMPIAGESGTGQGPRRRGEKGNIFCGPQLEKAARACRRQARSLGRLELDDTVFSQDKPVRSRFGDGACNVGIFGDQTRVDSPRDVMLCSISLPSITTLSPIEV